MEAQEENDRRARRAEQIRQLFRESMIGDFFRAKTFEGWDMSQNKKPFLVAQKYLETFDEMKTAGMGLMMTGPVGTGKTHLAAAIAGGLIERHFYSVVFQSWSRTLAQIKESFDKKRQETTSEFRLIAALEGCDLLVIDDLGKEKVTEWSQETLFSLVDARYCTGRPIIVTSNFKPSELAQMEGAASISRMIEKTYPVEFTGHDFRMKKIKK